MFSAMFDDIPQSATSTRGAAKLRLLIARIAAEEFKSYELPALGERLGLAPGTEQEAGSSKRAYMTSRLAALKEEQLIEVGKELAKDFSNPELDSLLASSSPADANISAAFDRFDRDVIHRRWTSALDRRSTDPEGAITLARTLLEDVIKWLLMKEGVAFSDSADLPQLYRLIAKELRLAPDAHTESVFKEILGSCQSIVGSLGALRNKLSDAHSVGPLRVKPKPRHAELAVNLAGATATFLIATWEAKIFNLDQKS